MRKLCCITILFFAVSIAANAQTMCPVGSVCVAQTTLQQCADTADKLIAARDVIAKFETERSMSIAERTAAQTLIKGLNDYLAVKDRIIADYERISKLKDDVIVFYQTLVTKLTDQINKPKSGWAKFAQAVERVFMVIVGIGIGRGLGI